MRFFLSLAFAFIACPTAWAHEVPTRKPGLWSVTLLSERAAPVTAIQCTDKAHDTRILLSVAAGQENCRAPRVSREKDGYHLDMMCSVHGASLMSRFVLSGDFKSKYYGHFNLDAPPDKYRNTPQHFEGQWLGECPSGMKPGDVKLPNGIIINVLKHKH